MSQGPEQGSDARRTWSPGAIARWVRPRRWRLVGCALGLVAVALVLIVAHSGRAVAPLGVLLTVVALLVLIGGGNLLEGWMGIRHRSPQYSEPEERVEDDATP